MSDFLVYLMFTLLGLISGFLIGMIIGWNTDPIKRTSHKPKIDPADWWKHKPMKFDRKKL